MRLQEIDSGLFRSYGESSTMKVLDPGNNVYAGPTVKQVTGSNVGKAGEENSTDSNQNVDMQAVSDAADALQKRLAEQGVHLKFEVVHSERGQIEVEVTDEANTKVLMRIPPKGVLKINAQGRTAIGSFLNLRS